MGVDIVSRCVRGYHVATRTAKMKCIIALIVPRRLGTTTKSVAFASVASMEHFDNYFVKFILMYLYSILLPIGLILGSII